MRTARPYVYRAGLRLFAQARSAMLARSRYFGIPTRAYVQRAVRNAAGSAAVTYGAQRAYASIGTTEAPMLIENGSFADVTPMSTPVRATSNRRERGGSFISPVVKRLKMAGTNAYSYLTGHPTPLSGSHRLALLNKPTFSKKPQKWAAKSVGRSRKRRKVRSPRR